MVDVGEIDAVHTQDDVVQSERKREEGKLAKSFVSLQVA